MNPFKKPSTLNIIDQQIAIAEKSLVENTVYAEHYAAAAEGNRNQLKKLRAMRDAESAPAVIPNTVAKKATPPKPHLAASRGPN